VALLQGTRLLETFLDAPRATTEDLRPGSIAIIGLPHDATKISRRGAAEAPAEIRAATSMFHFAVTEMAAGEVVDIDRQLAFRWAGAEMFDLGDLPLTDDVDSNLEAISDAIEAAAASGALLVVLGGDHFVTFPVVRGLSRATKNPPSYLHIDMHLDLADDVPGYGKYASGTPVRRLIEAGSLDPQRVAIVGVESFQHRNEWSYARETGIEVVSAAALRHEGVAATTKRLYDEHLSHNESDIYVSLDIDVLARAYAPGTGNAVGASGLLPDELFELVQVIAQWPLRGLDLVEVSPRLDPTGRTAALGAALLIEALQPRLFTSVAW
jgi:arginase family enzyme